ncbi:helix-turn-helix transcriptional regulator [Paenarthrobacter sp. CM16]|uniref:winged helix-turn-helix transcriptional regulator n=1 Tax=Paenarthrobacter sp. CM16 TaxID=2738447 RepID=UPI0015546FD5|nr:helix-turn-helix domain-containing protein [Paenarthrobacter sp. CM16]NQD86459.1 helix-turn-helix transcriptional regulator [Paenarthrobacter sp. CM16]
MKNPADKTADGPRACFIATGLGVLGERWALLALREMSLGVHRFDQIAGNTGASRDILAGRLRTLESHSVIERVQYSERPPRYEYHLTTSGAEVAPILISLAAWSSTWMRDETPRSSYRHTCGADLKPVLSCAECGDEFTPGSLMFGPLVSAAGADPAS